MNLLFICRHNRMRSTTAETIFRLSKHHSSRSAGLTRRSKVRISEELINWADIIFIMEEKYLEDIRKEFANCIPGKKIVSLEIQDFYFYMEPALVELIKERVSEYLKLN